MQTIKFDYDAFLVAQDGAETLVETTSADVAKAAGKYDERNKYEPLIGVTESGMIVEPLETLLLENDEIDQVLEFPYGKSEQNLIKVYKSRDFIRNTGIKKPVKGTLVNIDGKPGTVSGASPTRVMVDFNHKYAGKNLRYSVKVLSRHTEGLELVDDIMKAFGVSGHAVSRDDEFVRILLPNVLQNSPAWRTLKWKVISTLYKAGFDRIQFVENYMEPTHEPK